MAATDNAQERLKSGIDAFQQENFSQAFALLRPLAEKGDAKAQCHVASMYQGGLGVEASGIKAVEWYLRAAEQQVREEKISAIAYNNLGTIYGTGMPGIVANERLAKEYWRKAEELGFKMVPGE